MIRRFAHAGSAARIVFGPGVSAEAGTWVDTLDCRRALVLTTPGQAGMGQRIADALGGRGAGVFAHAAMHTPVAVTVEAVAAAEAAGADCVVSAGGGSTTGLGKAIVLRTGLHHIAIPTTYAGSEVTDVLGETADGGKTTMRDPRLRPDVVLYDPELTIGLPVAVSVASALNAVAHAAEGLYAEDRNPLTDLMAAEGLRAIRDGLPGVAADPADLEARSETLYGAWLCGTVLGSVAMALHHKLCHTLGGSFGLPHAETHAILLPHTIGFNAAAVPDLMAPLTAVFGAPAGAGLHDFARRVGAPQALREIGLAEADLDRAAALAVEAPYANPRPFDAAAIRTILEAAWAGERPAA